MLIIFFRTVAVSRHHQLAGNWIPPANCEHSCTHRFDSFMHSEVLAQLLNLDVNKAAGSDGISASFLKEVANEIVDPLTVLYNKSIQSGVVPLDWKKSHVTPVHKGGDTSDSGNFCPISVVPVVAKILEKLIVYQLCGYLKSHKLFHGHQGAYRCGRSSEQILLYAVDTIINSFDRGRVVCAAFLDLRKAFDSLDHSLLL